MTLETLRHQVDRIDSKLLQLLSRRASLVVRIGEIKKKHGLPVYDGKRELEVLARLMRSNAGPLSKKAIRSIFSAVLRHSRKLQDS